MSYIKTMNGVKYLVQHELDMASEEHGEKFHSNHEAYAVIKEEIEETSDELATIADSLDRMWCSIMVDEKIGVHLEYIEKHAMQCACEAIQVAAMARKAMR